MIKYELTFEEAKKLVMDGKGWMQGDKFVAGAVLMISGGIVARESDPMFAFNFLPNQHNPKQKLTSEYIETLKQQNYRLIKDESEAVKNAKTINVQSSLGELTVNENGFVIYVDLEARYDKDNSDITDIVSFNIDKDEKRTEYNISELSGTTKYKEPFEINGRI